jgi:nitroimidazol reductase NimA-like FMN-containing flavoprotein (pyridoxamine 5'-phosphate oxidase superfamily)
MGSSRDEPHHEEGADSCHPSERRNLKDRSDQLGRWTLGPRAEVGQNGLMSTFSLTPTQTEHDLHAPTPGSSTEEGPKGVRPSDLARRVTVRRNELGMSVDELAKRAGIDPGYLRYFERSPDALLSAGTMILMAVALDTTPTELMGGHMDRPLGHGRAGPHPVLDTLTREQCEAHLAAGGIGRVLMVTERGPVAVPVNFEFTNGEVVFSTDESKAKRVEIEHFVGFEIDRVDEAMSEGWSVLVTGRGRRISDQDEYQRLASLDLEAWAGGPRHTLVAIAADQVTGRVIVHQSPPEED